MVALALKEPAGFAPVSQGIPIAASDKLPGMSSSVTFPAPENDNAAATSAAARSSNWFVRGWEGLKSTVYGVYEGAVSLFAAYMLDSPFAVSETSSTTEKHKDEIARAEAVAANVSTQLVALAPSRLKGADLEEWRRAEHRRLERTQQEALMRRDDKELKAKQEADDVDDDDKTREMLEMMMIEGGIRHPSTDNAAAYAGAVAPLYVGQGIARLRGAAEDARALEHQAASGVKPRVGAESLKAGGRMLKGAAGFAVAGAASELVMAGFEGYIEGRAGSLLTTGKMGTTADGWTGAGTAIASNIGNVALEVGLNLIPGYTAYQEFRAGNYGAAAAWLAVDVVGVAASVLSFGLLAAPVEGVIAATKMARAAAVVGKAARTVASAETLEKTAEVTAKTASAVKGAHRGYVAKQAVEGVDNFRNFLKTPKGQAAMVLMEKEIMKGGAKKGDLKAYLAASNMPPEFQKLVLEEHAMHPAPSPRQAVEQASTAQSTLSAVHSGAFTNLPPYAQADYAQADNVSSAPPRTRSNLRALTAGAASTEAAIGNAPAMGRGRVPSVEELAS